MNRRVHVGPVPALFEFGVDGCVSDFYGIQTSRDLNDGRVVEGMGELFRVDRRGGDHHLEVPAFLQQVSQNTEDEVDVEAAFMGLVHDDRVISLQERVGLDFREEDAVGHHFDANVGPRPFVEPNLISNRPAQGLYQFLGKPACRGDGGDPPRLGMANDPPDAPSRLKTHLRDLGGLSRPCLTGDDDDGMPTDSRDYLFSFCGDRQDFGIGDSGYAAPAAPV